MRGEANGGEDHRPRGEEQEHEVDEEEEEERRGGEEPPPTQRNVQAQRPAARPSTGQQHPPPPPPGVMRTVGYVGKHRLSAAISRLDQELQSLQEELNELETMEPASTACQDVITSTEGKPDPLLPITSGPENSSWDRWFQRVRSSRSNKWWASRGSDFS